MVVAFTVKIIKNKQFQLVGKDLKNTSLEIRFFKIQ